MTDGLPRRSEMRRRTYLGAVATILPFWLIDVTLPDSSPWVTLPLRAAWAGAFLVAGLLAGRVRETTLDRMAVVAAAISSLSMTGIIQYTGGGDSPFLYALPLLPVLMAVVEPWEELPAWGSGAASIAGIVWIGLAEALPAASIAAWVAGIGAATAWATFGFRESRRSRQAAVDASRLAAIGRLAAGVAHEINNPLAFAKANVHFLREALPPTADGDEGREVADEALIGLERIRGIVCDLRGFARQDPESLVPVPPAEVVGEALRISSLQLHGRVRVIQELAPELPCVPVARSRMVQVLVNLLVNAADALEGRSQGEVRLTAGVRGERLVLGVEDNGPGVPPEARGRLFRPFTSTKPLGKGLGLGLALSRDYVEQAGGTLRYQDRAGGGARFEIELPLAVDDAA